MKLKLNLIIIFFTCSILSAQNTYEFLRLDMSPRAAALAGSFVSTYDDPNAMFYNPAGIATLEGQPISLSFVKHLLDINSASLSYSRHFEGIGRFAAGVQYINYGTFTAADEFGNKTGEFGAGDFALTIGYANQLDENFYYGANVKFIYSSIEEVSSTGIAVDLGLQYLISDSRWSFGISALNLGGQLSTYYDTQEDLPLDVRAGFSKSLEHLPFTFFFSINKLNEKYDDFADRFKQFSVGGEFRLSQSFHLRLGYDNEKRKELKIGTTAGLAGFSLGVGLNISNYLLDYAFSSMGSIGSLHRIGVSTSL